ncbi:MAG: succinate--CoA ligase subunit alpha [Candidatus Bipolaricaulia bacterium]
MSILIDESTNVLVTGITGSEGSFHTERMIDYGTNVVAGVRPGKGGETVLNGVPVYNTVEQAARDRRIDAAAVFVPAKAAADAVLEAADAGVELVVCITEHIPLHHMLKTYEALQRRGTQLIGPNCPGLLSTRQSKIGIMPGEIFREGPIGVVSRSGTLTYEIVDQLTRAELGQTTAVGIGGDPVIGSSFIDVLPQFEADPETELVVLVGEIGGNDEEEAAAFAEGEMDTPVVAYIAGFTAPPGKRMGHAGAIVTGSSGTAEAKAKALEAKGVPVGRSPQEMVQLAHEALQSGTRS